MKKVLYVIIALVVVYLVLCLIGPKETIITRSISINANPEMVKAQLGDLKFFTEKWSPWTEKDPQMKMTFEGEAGKPGHKYSWEGNDQVGKGSQEVLSVSGDTITQKLILLTWHAEGTIYLVTTPENNGTKVTWTLVMPNGFLSRAMGLFFNPEKYMAPDFENGLAKLKTAMEGMSAAPTAATYEVKEVDWTERTFVGTKALVTFDKIPTFYAENLGKIMGEMAKNKVEPMMAPTGIFWTFDEQKGQTEMAAAMCVAKGTKLKGFESWDIPASKVLHVAYYGDYAKTMPAHAAIGEYMAKNNLKQSIVVEEYANDPGEVKDTAQWLTNIYYVLLPSGK